MSSLLESITEGPFTAVMIYLLVIAAFWIVLGVAYYRNPDGRVGRALQKFQEQPQTDAYLEVQDQIFERMPIASVLMIMLGMQVVIAHHALPEEHAQSIMTMFSIGPVAISPFEVAMFILLWWLAGAKVKYLLARGGEIVGVYEPSWAKAEVADE